MLLISIAVIIDIIIGDPEWFPHPVIFIGRLINLIERYLYKEKGRWRGVILVIIICAVVWGLTEIVLCISAIIGVKSIVTVFFLYTALSVNSLAKAGREIKIALKKGIKEARMTLAKYVGRETNKLDELAVIRGAVETIAENTIDGVIAPLFFMMAGLIFNAPLQFVFMYKVVNTLDSMVGYNNKKYCDYGFFAAKTDDILNFIPARLGSVIMLFSGMVLGYDIKNGIKVFARDRKKHRSPNSAHPESAVAGLLGIRLGGPNYYFGKLVEKPNIGSDAKKPEPADITRTNRILYVSTVMITVVMIMTEVLL